MGVYHGKETKARKKRKYEMGRYPTETKLGEEKRKVIRTKGGNIKVRLLSAEYANVVIDGKPTKCKILEFVENPVSFDYSRRHIITKGTILKVLTPENKEIKVKVTSRPGQDGVLNAVPLL
ncbi:MAG TPA: 30S ribosomal protein S8e [Candidatus Altiarchaeales archaeon]|nr:30S ribosomal protein S8e [Candidatus Altiarchaeales archaeon]